jgi:hypothetical protein
MTWRPRLPLAPVTPMVAPLKSVKVALLLESQ